MIFADVTRDPIAPGDLLDRVGAAEDGAVLLFLGTVRDHNDGRAVTGMEYEAYEAMAREVLGEIAAEVHERWATDRIGVVHRVGRLDVGEVSVAVAVSTPHRAEAYAASRYVIEEIKVRLPVWKKEHYVDGERRWVPGRRPSEARPSDAATPGPGAPTAESVEPRTGDPARSADGTEAGEPGAGDDPADAPRGTS